MPEMTYREHVIQRQREYRAANIEKIRESNRIRYRERYSKGEWLVLDRERRLRKLHGITLDDYDAMLKTQHRRCAICRKKPDKRVLVVDHNHSTGEVRGLLCNTCNRAIGLLKDDPDLLARAVKYLRGAK